MNRLAARAAVVGLVLSVCNALSYRTCESANGRVDDMFIPGCEGGNCIMHKGETKAVHIAFTPYCQTQDVTTVVHIKIGWLTFPVALNEPEACLRSLPCPLVPGAPYQYVFNITIDSSSPSFTGTVRWELQDEMGLDLACTEFKGGIN